MRRFKARGRLFPQFYSTDERVGAVSARAWTLYSLMWVNGDDQGRLGASPANIKNACCPNREDILKADILALLQELVDNHLIILYDTPKSRALQFTDWWDVQGMQWAWPSEFPAPLDWQDHLRYKEGRDHVVKVNWPPSPELSGEPSGEPLSPPDPLLREDVRGREEEDRREEEEKRREEKRRSAETSGEHSGELSGERVSAPDLSPALSYGQTLDSLIKNHELAFGSVPDSRIQAQLRDLASEIALRVRKAQIHDAFHETAMQPQIKWTVSYVRAILCDWLGISKVRK